MQYEIQTTYYVKILDYFTISQLRKFTYLLPSHQILVLFQLRDYQYTLFVEFFQRLHGKTLKYFASIVNFLLRHLPSVLAMTERQVDLRDSPVVNIKQMNRKPNLVKNQLTHGLENGHICLKFTPFTTLVAFKGFFHSSTIKTFVWHNGPFICQKKYVTFQGRTGTSNARTLYYLGLPSVRTFLAPRETLYPTVSFAMSQTHYEPFRFFQQGK